MKIKFSLLFYIRKSKNYVGGPMPVWMRITVNCKRSETPFGRSVSHEQQRVTYSALF